MTRTTHHYGQNPLPGSNTLAALVATLGALLVLTPDQIEYLGGVLALPATLLGLASMLKQA